MEETVLSPYNCDSYMIPDENYDFISQNCFLKKEEDQEMHFIDDTPLDNHNRLEDDIFLEKMKEFYFDNDIDELEKLLKVKFGADFYNSKINYSIAKFKLFKFLSRGNLIEGFTFYHKNFMPLLKKNNSSNWRKVDKNYQSIFRRKTNFPFNGNDYLNELYPSFENKIKKMIKDYNNNNAYLSPRDKFEEILIENYKDSLSTNKMNLQFYEDSDVFLSNAKLNDLPNSTPDNSRDYYYNINNLCYDNCCNNSPKLLPLSNKDCFLDDYSSKEDYCPESSNLNSTNQNSNSDASPPHSGIVFNVLKESDQKNSINLPKFEVIRDKSQDKEAQKEKQVFIPKKINKQKTPENYLHKILPLLAKFKPVYTKRENIDKKAIRRFRHFLIKAKKEGKLKMEMDSAFWVLFLNGELFPPIEYNDPDIKEKFHFKSFNASYIIWLFSRDKIKTYYDQFIEEEGEDFVNSLVKAYNIEDSEKEDLKNYIKILPTIFELKRPDNSKNDSKDLSCSNTSESTKDEKNKSWKEELSLFEFEE